MKSLVLLALCALLKYAGAGCYSGTDVALCSTCSGYCTSDNGCTCSDAITNCMPAGSECPMADNSCCNNAAGWYWHSDTQCCTQIGICNPGCTSDETCKITQNLASCVCNSTTYIGIKTSDLKPVVNCDGGAMTASISLCQLKQLGYDPNSFHIINNSVPCTFIYPDTINNIQVESLQVKAAVGWCGNTVTKTNSKIYFTNTLYINPNSGPLITKNPIGVNFSCEYNLTMQTSLNFSLHPIQSTNYLTSQNGSGTFTVTMAAYYDSSFTEPIQENDNIDVGSPIYLGVFAPTMDGNVFALRVEQCIATPTNDPTNPNNVVFVTGGCAASADVQTTVLENGNSTQARIQTSAFLFNGFEEVYIFCDVRLCNKTDGCTGCDTSRAAGPDTARMGIQLNLNSYYSSNSESHIAAPWTILAASLLGLIVKLF